MEHSSLADITVWQALPVEIQQAIQRLVNDGIVLTCPNCSEEYDRGFDNGRDSLQNTPTPERTVG